MGRQPCCDKVGLKRGPWTIEEDHKLMNFILNNGIHCWRMVPKLAGLLRCGKSCRLRWINYLRPDLKRGGFTEVEENQIIQLHSRLGNRWSKIASHFPGRTDNEIKNHWNTRIKRRLKQLGIDPVTHKSIEQAEIDKISVNDETSSKISNLPQLEDQSKNDDEKTSGKKELVSSMDETCDDDLLKNYEMLCGSLDLGSWINQLETNNNNNNNNNNNMSYSSSMSIEESNNPSIGEYSSVQDGCSVVLQQWVDSVDSILSWDDFNHLGDDIFSLGK
ncbi:hypothetical protein JCGZ_10188 [Jatropha curcas]|uniref:MYB family protein n=1 Tax=Jatropha curcas TaxID=180498 RepID=A0A067LG98_JATCU|nr:myb-related protein 315 [Jatropha curcas]AIT52317.1 MYB family protein [Jatropha curcas]KDP46348.1 hypothetical protein JCGZ_10188 [Jatropha curcas]